MIQILFHNKVASFGSDTDHIVVRLISRRCRHERIHPDRRLYGFLNNVGNTFRSADMVAALLNYRIHCKYN